MMKIKRFLVALLLACAPLAARSAELPPLTAPGVTAPIRITSSTLGIPAILPPGIFVAFAPGTTAICSVQATASVDTVSSSIPAIPAAANWQPLDPAGSLSNLTASTNATLTGAATAVRLNCSALSAGSVTFGVAQ